MCPWVTQIDTARQSGIATRGQDPGGEARPGRTRARPGRRVAARAGRAARGSYCRGSGSLGVPVAPLPVRQPGIGQGAGRLGSSWCVRGRWRRGVVAAGGRAIRLESHCRESLLCQIRPYPVDPIRFCSHATGCSRLHASSRRVSRGIRATLATCPAQPLPFCLPPLPADCVVMFHNVSDLK